MILDLKTYQHAKSLKKPLQDMLAEVTRAIEQFLPFAAFSPIRPILWELRRSKTVLEAHLQRCEQIIESRGRKFKDDEGK